ncbi:MAG: hypothetical protein LQ350_003289 [Teloschistes chrysophthalmus]|nr:MAG: hypothetical protein LQ350_003289 [Niorma chrysophthalma]
MFRGFSASGEKESGGSSRKTSSRLPASSKGKGEGLASPNSLRALEQDDDISILTIPRGRKSSEATSSHQAEIVQELIALRDQGEEAHPGRFVVPSHTVPARIPEGQDSIMAYEVNDFTRYRSTSDVHDLEDDIQQGLAKLDMVGCGQFSKRAFEEIKESISNKKPFVFDLREEFHAFVDGVSVSWYAPGNHNWGKNPGRSPEEIFEKQIKKVGKLKTKSGPLVIPSRAYLKKQMEPQWEASGSTEPLTIEDFVNAEIQTESEMIRELGGEYKHFPITDHTRPSDIMIDQMVETFRNIATKPETTLIIHCHGGMGRTTFAMIMYDMLHNAPNVARDVIVARQIKLRNRDEPKPDQLPEAKAYQKVYAAEKIELRDMFYEYARQNPIGKHNALPWTAFLDANK